MLTVDTKDLSENVFRLLWAFSFLETNYGKTLGTLYKKGAEFSL